MGIGAVGKGQDGNFSGYSGRGFAFPAAGQYKQGGSHQKQH
jgi:hypothetical protein